MTSPQVERASKSTRTEAEVRAAKDLPVGFGTDGRRAFGECQRCHHHGTDCHCSVEQVQNLGALHQVAHDIAAERICNGWSFTGNDIEIDEDAATSEGEDGCWVRAWVHIERDAYSDQPTD